MFCVHRLWTLNILKKKRRKTMERAHTVKLPCGIIRVSRYSAPKGIINRIIGYFRRARESKDNEILRQDYSKYTL